MMTMTVTKTPDPRQFMIENRDEWVCEDWANTYVSFSGYFGAHNPNTFAAAPELLAAMKQLRAEYESIVRSEFETRRGMPEWFALNVAGADAAIAKAEAEV